MLYINKTGLSFSAAFVRKHNLQDAAAIYFLQDDEDPYFLGFRVTDDTRRKNALSLNAAGRGGKGLSAGFTVKAQELFNKSPVLSAIARLSDKSLRTFEIQKNAREDFFSVLLRPAFETTLAWKEQSRIDAALMGIYRYLDASGNVLYIGKGQIAARAAAPERADWGVARIEYSVLSSDEECFEWESYYLDLHRSDTGALPPLNRIAGRSSDPDK